MENVFGKDFIGRWQIEMSREEDGKVSFSVVYSGYFIEEGVRKLMCGRGFSDRSLEDATMKACESARINSVFTPTFPL